ncbi:hypothetical protein RND81_13G124600 [Saponaria officinalis]|uniref:BHLH domain-containing protein n=1 Tax=Saponaria officinalis TaxID=3572 RepID=A0AAW1GWY1_SAPOF
MSEIWPYNAGDSRVMGLKMENGGFISSLIDNLLNNNGDCNLGQMKKNGLIEESIVTQQSGNLCDDVNVKKKREIFLEDESSKKNSNDKPRKRMKTSAGGETCSRKTDEKRAEQMKDYIHVRARRGQATDSHSLAERARREKISERMKVLQDLVPGCNKVIGKALVLDEIINYVQSLQRQVEFLSMKLEAVNSGIIPSIIGFHSKDVHRIELSPFDPSGMMFSAQTAQGMTAAEEPQSEWLHIQLGGSFERTT